MLRTRAIGSVSKSTQSHAGIMCAPCSWDAGAVAPVRKGHRSSISETCADAAQFRRQQEPDGWTRRVLSAVPGYTPFRPRRSGSRRPQACRRWSLAGFSLSRMSCACFTAFQIAVDSSYMRVALFGYVALGVQVRARCGVNLTGLYVLSMSVTSPGRSPVRCGLPPAFSALL